ncbi:AAA family ATPase [Geminocystis sp. GBBB08]|uniref:AAA family ATPase n=1 Tax=Geminocystis sp. GBBB08 TaxID=2604140 RepID=UPI0027E36AE6|nr:AAA family ATPase [Geminocystis sp. GBBB08]MBL1209589.1 ATP-dependent Clp protease ATP-binding subunit [Geminocystis sp. GBBB08]
MGDINKKFSPLTPKWQKDLVREHQAGKHILLFGNILDLFFHDGQYVDIYELLKDYLSNNNYGIVTQYDDIDGFRFIAPEMEEKWQEINYQKILEDNPELANENNWETNPNDLTIPPPQLRLENRPESLTRGRIPLESGIAQARVLITQDQISCAVILDIGDILTTDANRILPDEKAPLKLLKKLSIEAQFVTNQEGKNIRNTVIILASDLNKVPTWIYQGNPSIALVEVPKPSKAERLQFVELFYQDFYHGESLYQLGEWRFASRQGDIHGVVSHPHLEYIEPKFTQNFADLTDGLCIKDLHAILRCNSQEQIPFSQVERLIEYYKYGEREDYWQININPQRVKNAERQLKERVIGQNRAIQRVINLITTAKVGISLTGKKRGKPKGVFFFVGSTGVGKTEIAKAIASLIFGSEEFLIKFDMSEYQQEHSAEKLIGSPPGYVGYQEGGVLTNQVLEKPYSILLFDEIEKAHPRVLDKFLQILDGGRLTDSKGQTAYFDQTVIIFTSNIGASNLSDSRTGVTIRDGISEKIMERLNNNRHDFSYDEVESHFKNEVRWYFMNRLGRAELLNKLGEDNIVVFDILRPSYVQAIAQNFLDSLDKSAFTQYRLSLKFDDSIFEVLADKMGKIENLLFGGRRIRSLIESLIEQPLNYWVFHHYPDLKDCANQTLSLSFKREEGDELIVTPISQAQ